MDLSGPLNWTLINEMANTISQEDRDQAEWRIGHTGKLPMHHFQITIGTLFGLAALAFAGRIVIRLTSRRRLLIDDGFIVVSFACLASAIAVFYKRARMIYLTFTLLRGDLIVALIASQEIEDVYAQLNWAFAYITLLWTTIFMIKFCYFAFFYNLLRLMPKALVRFYWSSVILTVICWFFVILQQLIPCPYFGPSSTKCFPTLPVSYKVMNFIYWFGSALDVLTDIAIVSIPIFVLRKSQMGLETKVGLGLFLCLSFFMLACAIIRAGGTYYKGSLDTPWQVFWLHAESCISVIMASITVYKSALIGTDSYPRGSQRLINRIPAKHGSGHTPVPKEEAKKSRSFNLHLLSTSPGATLVGSGSLLDKRTTKLTGTEISTGFDIDNVDYHGNLTSLQRVILPSDRNARAGFSEQLTMSPSIEEGRPSPAQTDQCLYLESLHGYLSEIQQQPRTSSSVARFFQRFLIPQSLKPALHRRTMRPIPSTPGSTR